MKWTKQSQSRILAQMAVVAYFGGAPPLTCPQATDGEKERIPISAPDDDTDTFKYPVSTTPCDTLFMDTLTGLPIDDQGLAKVLKQAKKLWLYTQTLHSQLPSTHREGVVVVRVRLPQLTLVAPSPAVANQIKFLSPDLISHLKMHHPELAGLEQMLCRVNHPEPHIPEKRTQPKPTLSPESQSLLKQCAEGLEESSLKEVLEKMGGS